MPNLVGTGSNQTPTNAMLGGLAYQDSAHANLTDVQIENISKVKAQLTHSPIHGFIYDTSKDSDGGSWRHRCQHTSWYNEELGTYDRGHRREFPSMALITCMGGTVSSYGTDNDSMKVAIYDLDDPNASMWMEFEGWSNDGNLLRGGANYPLVCTHMLNGILVIGRNGGYGISYINFVNDHPRHFWDAAGWQQYAGNIAERNKAKDGQGPMQAPGLRNPAGLSLDMRVVDGISPSNPSTGLAQPVILVGTASGICVIKHTELEDEYIYDYSRSSDAAVYQCHLGPRGRTYAGLGRGAVYVIDYAENDNIHNTYTSLIYGGKGNDTSFYPRIVRMYGSARRMAKDPYGFSVGTDHGSGAGLHRVYENLKTPNAQRHSAVSLILNNANTGWMLGDCIFSTFNDTDATDVSSSNELLTNGDFSNNFLAGWSLSGTTTPTYNNGGVLLTTGTVDGAIAQAISGTGTWIISWRVVNNNGGFFQFFANGNNIGGSWTSSGSIEWTGTWNGAVSGSNNSTSAFYLRHGGGGNGTLDNLSVRKKVSSDLSRRNHSLRAYGSITKTPVATGAELCSVGGFSNSNYIRQSYNPNADFSTAGKICIMGWVKMSNIATTGFIFDRNGTHVGGGTRYSVYTEGSLLKWYLYDSGSSSSEISASIAEYSNTWWHFCCTREAVGYWNNAGESNMRIYINGRLITNTAKTQRNTTNTEAEITIGHRWNLTSGNHHQGEIALLRFSNDVPLHYQMKKIYQDEKQLFQENAKCSLYGSSDVITALAYDDSTGVLHAGTSGGRSDFNGLRRINNTTTAVTDWIAAEGGYIAER